MAEMCTACSELVWNDEKGNKKRGGYFGVALTPPDSDDGIRRCGRCGARFTMDLEKFALDGGMIGQRKVFTRTDGG